MVLPIHMGVILNDCRWKFFVFGTPHTHGGDSATDVVNEVGNLYSPYTWG